jgi:hypothetical protein
MKASGMSAGKERNEEIARRIQELDSGAVKPIPWEEAGNEVSATVDGNSERKNW